MVYSVGVICIIFFQSIFLLTVWFSTVSWLRECAVTLTLFSVFVSLKWIIKQDQTDDLWLSSTGFLSMCAVSAARYLLNDCLQCVWVCRQTNVSMKWLVQLKSCEDERPHFIKMLEEAFPWAVSLLLSVRQIQLAYQSCWLERGNLTL